MTAMRATVPPTTPATPTSPAGPRTPVTPDWLAELLAELVPVDGPGAVIGVYDGGDLVAAAARGLASLEHQIPITTHTIFDIASVSKQITATCVVLLARDGKLSLDDDVRQFVPELQLDRPVTLRQCAQHTGGLRDYLSLVDALGAPLATVELESDFLRVMSPVRSTNFVPGTDISYSNTGYVLLATVVGRVACGTLQQFARERVFEPLGMERTRFRDGLGFVMPDLAWSYERVGDEYRRADLAEAQVGDGAVLTCVSDLAGWQGFLLDGRGLGADVRDEIVAPAVLADGRTCRYGLGVRLADLDGRRMLWHGGAMYHYVSELLCLPEAGIGVSVLANRRDVPVGEVARRVARAALGLAARSHPGAPARGWPDALDLAGWWFAPDVDGDLCVEPGPDGGLSVRLGDEPYQFARKDDESWCLGEYACLSRTPGGEALQFTDQIGRSVSYRRPVRGVEPAVDQVVGSYESAELAAELVIGNETSLTARLGSTPPSPMTYLGHDGEDALYVAGRMMLRLRPDAGLLFASGGDLCRLRFVRAATP